MSSTPGMGPFFRSLTGSLPLGLLVLVELAILRLAGSGRYHPVLAESENAAALLFLHNVSKMLVLAFVATFMVAGFRSGLRLPRVSPMTARIGLLATNLSAFLCLLVIFQILPASSLDTPRLDASLIMAYAAAICLLSLVALTGTALVLPRQVNLPKIAIGYGSAVLAAAILLGQLGWVVGIARGVIEKAALDLSLWFIGLSGHPMPMLDVDGRNPVMASPDFAISIAPSCSGYQGMISAFVLLGAYVGLEWRKLRLDRALILCVAAVGGTFVLNALRIAILFYIGDEISPEVAVNGFHSQFGVLALLASTGLAVLAMELKPFRREAGDAPAENASLRIDLARIFRLMLPLAVYLVAGMIAGLFVGTFNWLYPVPVLAGALWIWLLRHPLAREIARAPGLISVAVGAVVYLLWIIMIPADAGRAGMLADALSSAPLWLAIIWIAFRVLGSSLVVPVVEELAFRAGLIRLLEAISPPWMGRWTQVLFVLTASSVAFGLLHANVLAATVAGLAYGALFLRRRALADAVVAHAVTNFLICLHVLGLGEWSYW